MRSWQTYLREGRGVFRRHWKLLVIPIPLALLITIWVVVSTPTMYQSQAAIWSNTTAAQAAAINATEPTPLTPAAAEQSLLDELLATNAFRTTVATTSPLAAWLAAHPESHLTPSGLVALLHGATPMAARIRSAVLSGTSTTLDGPQVMTIGFAAQSPTLARETLGALLGTFVAERTALVGQSQGTFRVLDVPSVPGGPTTGTTKRIETVFAGLLAGVIVTLLAVVVLTLLGERARRRDAAPRPTIHDPHTGMSGTPPTPARAVAASAQTHAASPGDPQPAHARGAQS
jgi:hypothetical protein